MSREDGYSGRMHTPRRVGVGAPCKKKADAVEEALARVIAKERGEFCENVPVHSHTEPKAVKPQRRTRVRRERR